MRYGSVTGLATDQQLYIIPVNSPTMTATDAKLSADELPSFITQNGNELVVNGTNISDSSLDAPNTSV